MAQEWYVQLDDKVHGPMTSGTEGAGKELRWNPAGLGIFFAIESA